MALSIDPAFSTFITRPISAVLIALAVASLAYGVVDSQRKGKSKRKNSALSDL